jgi:hypothetical protein
MKRRSFLALAAGASLAPIVAAEPEKARRFWQGWRAPQAALTADQATHWNLELMKRWADAKIVSKQFALDQLMNEGEAITRVTVKRHFHGFIVEGGITIDEMRELPIGQAPHGEPALVGLPTHPDHRGLERAPRTVAYLGVGDSATLVRGPDGWAVV